MQDITHSVFPELLESHNQGLLWVTRSLNVQYANRKAKKLLGISATHTLGDTSLAQAVVEVIAGGAPRTLATMGVGNGGGGVQPELRCRVTKGLTADDAFIQVEDPQAIDPSEALEDLMVVLRADLHAPLHWVEQALRLAREEGCDEHTIDALADRVETLVAATRSLLDLASIWREGSLRTNDRIELLPLLHQAWAEVEPTALNHAFKVRFRSPLDTTEMAALYGSETWLRRVLVACLASAIRNAPTDFTLEIVYRQQGARAVIVLRDCAAFSDGQHGFGTMEGQGAPKARRRALPSIRLPVREHVGLKLCQHVLAMHGGRLREEEVEGQRNFIIDIPSGAPYHSQSGQIDIGQAQQYALDLAELMTRLRQVSGSASLNTYGVHP